MQVNIPLIHQVVVAQLAAARQGTHKVKRRGEVSGGGAKPYRQKGTGRARQGSTRAPQFAGGGVVHGPTPHDYIKRTPKKMKAAALRGALSDRARDGRLHVVESLLHGDSVPTHQDRGRRCSRRSASAATSSWSPSATTSRPGRACATSSRSTCSRRASSTPTTCSSATTWSSPRRRSSFLAGRPRAGRPRPVARSDRGGRAVIADPRDVIIAPVISEKSYGLLDENKYTFLVAPGRQQDRDQDRRRAGLRRQGPEREHAQPPGQAQAHQGRVRHSARTPSAPSSPSRPATASRSSGARSPDGPDHRTRPWA